MSKKKSLYFVVILLIVVGCFAGYKVYDHKQWEPVNQVVDRFLDSYNKGSDELVQYVLDEDESNPESCLYYSRFVKDDVTYDIKGHHKTKGQYIVDVEVTTVDNAKILDENKDLYEGLLAQSFQDENIKQLRAIKDKPMKTTTVSITLEPFDDTYYVVVDDDLLEVLSGGFYAYRPTIEEEE